MAEELGRFMACAVLEIPKVPVLKHCPGSLHCSTGNFTQESFHGRGKAAPCIFPVLGLSAEICAPSELCLVEKEERKMPLSLPRADKQES